MASQLISTSRVDRSDIPVLGNLITTFATTSIDGYRHSFIGDDKGWLYSHTRDDDSSQAETSPQWYPDFTFQASSEISSISMSKSLCVATSSGPSCIFLVRDLHMESGMFVFDLHRQGSEIWSSHLRDRTLVLGIKMKAVYIQDIEQPSLVSHLDTRSDVFAVHQHDDLVFTGARNGSIRRFDTRIDKSQGQGLFTTRFKNDKASVRYLTIIRDWQLLASYANGDLGSFDLRFPRESHPHMIFAGHVNSMNVNTPRLGIAIDPSEDFLFAAGQDCRIRAWSLRTGMPLHAPQSSSKITLQPRPPASEADPTSQSYENNPLAAVFPDPVVALQIATDRTGMSLWAASGSRLHRFYLGQRAC